MFKDKIQVVKHPADILPKKVGEIIPPQSQVTPLASYGMYPFYPHPQAPYLVSQPPSQQPNEHPNGKQLMQPATPATLPPTSMQDYNNKMKEPPLDLMTKPSTQPNDNVPVSLKENLPHSGPPPMSQSKFIGNYYPYK